MSGINRTLELRRRRQKLEMSPINEVKTVGDYTLVKCNEWYGLRSNGGQTLLVLAPIYDNIEVVDYNLCMVKVKDTYQLYDIANGSFVNLPEMNSYQRFDDMLEVSTDDGVGLYSCREKRMLIPPRYQETTHIVNGRYLWTKTFDGEYEFYDTVRADTVRCPKSTSECLDGPEDYMFVIIDHRLRCINEAGIFDSDRLRAFALRSNGRIRLSNNNRHMKIITDVYGNIIN